jgi:adenine-specific DNA-methyltransferase
VSSDAAVPDGHPNNGEVFTKRWVVELILDLVGYTSDRDLATLLAVEPACGAGAFLIPMVERLVESCRRHGRQITEASESIQAFDLLDANASLAKSSVAEVLASVGTPQDARQALVESWIHCEDFLLRADREQKVDVVVGNPPYIRLESVPPDRRAAYRAACPTMRGRSDIFVGFIETGLRLLNSGGALGFIVADRWMHNQYGAGLRQLVAKDFNVATVIAMHDVDAFEKPVSAYPAITIIRREDQAAPAVVKANSAFGPSAASEVRRWINTSEAVEAKRPSFVASRLSTWFPGDSLWPSGSPDQLALIADLEQRFPPLHDETTGTRVGIGVATGADKVFLTKHADIVEFDRLLPIALSGDIVTGEVKWSGTYLVRTWDEDGLVELREYPRLREYLERHEREVKDRYVARRDESRWYRTIDRVDSTLQHKRKLLVPDLKAAIHPVLDDGDFYPHHNLYHVTSTEWPTEVLGGLLLSGIANLFVGAYCVKMRGGCYRFQAQYLRRIRVPPVEQIASTDADALADAFVQRDRIAATEIALRLYGVSPSVARASSLDAP